VGASGNGRLEGKSAIITGAGRGIGESIARRFAAEGASVVIADIDERVASDVARAISEQGARAVACVVDVTDSRQVQSLVDTAVDEFGTVDILVNNAGLSTPAMIDKMSAAQWNNSLAVNLTGPFMLTQAVGRLFLARAAVNPGSGCSGKIVNVTSVAGLRGTVGQANYAAAKAGLVSITMSAAREWGRHGVNVNAVAFGLVETRMTERIRTDERFKKQYLAQIALGRYTTPEEIAPAVAFLASAEADYITGQVLNVCGGADIHA